MKELTPLQKLIMQEIKKHNSISEYLIQYNKCIKFESMGRYRKEGFEEQTLTSYYDDEIGEYTNISRHEFKCRFKPKSKCDDNIAKYLVNIYSNGEIYIYFDGTEYKR